LGLGISRKAVNAKKDGTVASLDDVKSDPADLGDDDFNRSKDADLRRWLTGEEDDLLSWLNEGDRGGTEAVSTISHSMEEGDGRAKSEIGEKELTELKLAVIDVIRRGLPGESLQDESLPTLAHKLREVAEREALSRMDLDRLLRDNQDMKKEIESAMASMPKDQRALIKKQIELAEREARMLAKEREQSTTMPNGDCVGASSMSELEERFQAELRQKENEFREKEKDYKAKVEYLAEELKRKSLEEQQKEDELKFSKMNSTQAGKELEMKLKDVQLKEKRMLLMEEEITRLKIDVRERDDELRKIKEVVGYKEQELLRREEDLDYRDKLIAGERRKLDEAKREVTNVEEVELKKRLEELKAEVSRKEEELIAKEKFLNAKSEELRLRESGVIDNEIERREEERAIEFNAAKVKTGNSRLDDLLLGGIPFGSNVLIHGPPFIGKEIMIDQFVAEGLKKGIPCIWVITDKTPKDIRDEMAPILSGYTEYESRGLVKYIDSYSRSMGEAVDDPHAIYIDEPTDHDAIMAATDKVAKEFKENHKYYRLAFRSVSTLVAYSDPNVAFRFLSPFCGRRKRDGAVSMYVIEKGMHGEQEIQMLGSIMDGMVDFKLDQLKSFFSIQGISDVQSRSYIRYTVGKHGLSIGSFSLDHIR
jgi:KaiC/GvpD/RAD55 family RecA-like ATPase